MSSPSSDSVLPKTLLSFFLHFLKPYKRYVAGLFLVSCLWAVQMSLWPYLMKVFVDRLSEAHGQAVIAHLTGPALCYVGLSLALGILFRFYDYLLMQFLPSLKRDVQHAMFSYLERHSHRYFQDHFAGSLSNKVMDMVRGSSEIFQMFMETCINPFFGISIALYTMWHVNPIFALIFAVWTVVFLTMAWVVAKKCQPYATAYAEAKSTVSGKIVDSISNMMNVRLFARHGFENNYLLTFTDDVVLKDRTVQRFLLVSRILLMLSITVMIGCMLWGLIWARSQNMITAGDFILIVTLTGRIVDVLWQVTNQVVRLSQEVGTCIQALSIVTKAHEIEDEQEAKSLSVTTGKIEFKDVIFRYQKPLVFNKLNVSIEGGSKVGLVGFSGSGKSTFVNLIFRFFDIQSGAILIDGQSVATVTQDSVYEAISMIPQDISLFHRSLMENIRYGRVTATDEEVINASKQAYCHDFICGLPEGYNSLVGERGIKLSGGQRQRIAIARAILKNSPILILDEATSALDSVTEGQIQESLIKLMQNRTSIVIAHRLSTLSQMDRLLVFDKGDLVQDGTHETLLSEPGHYQTLWRLQAHGFLPEEAGPKFI